MDKTNSPSPDQTAEIVTESAAVIRSVFSSLTGIVSDAQHLTVQQISNPQSRIAEQKFKRLLSVIQSLIDSGNTAVSHLDQLADSIRSSQ